MRGPVRLRVKVALEVLLPDTALDAKNSRYRWHILRSLTIYGTGAVTVAMNVLGIRWALGY